MSEASVQIRQEPRDYLGFVDAAEGTVDRRIFSDEEERRARTTMAIHTHGPAGFLEQDDGENWDQSTRGTRGVVARRHPLNFAMGLGHGAVQKAAGGPGFINTTINEHAQLWAWRSWAEWMEAADWNALKRDRSPPPTD